MSEIHCCYFFQIIAQSLKQFLEYEGDVVEAFSQPFSVGTIDVFGGTHVHHLKENGDQILVNNDTRQVGGCVNNNNNNIARVS